MRVSEFSVVDMWTKWRNLMNCLIKLSNADCWQNTSWRMTIDLKELAESAGKRLRDGYNGGSYVEYPIPRAKKLLKLIREYGTDADFMKCDEYLKTNKKLYSYWKGLF